MGQNAHMGNLIDQVLQECQEREAKLGAPAARPSVMPESLSDDPIAKTWTWETVKPQVDSTPPPAKSTQGLQGSYGSRLWGSNSRYFAEKIFGKVSD